MLRYDIHRITVFTGPASGPPCPASGRQLAALWG